MDVAQPLGPAKPLDGVVIPNQPRWTQRLIARLLVRLLRMIAATIRFKFNHVSAFPPASSPAPAIYCFWHNRLPLCTAVRDRFFAQRLSPAGAVALISASKDGAFLSAVLKRFGVEVVRGSSSRRGAQALLELTGWAEKGYDIAITPDGPRGPRYVVQEGVVSLAQLTGLPIIPGGYHLSSKFSMKSWDRLQIPLPFSTCNVTIAEPIRVARDATDAERESLRNQLERTLRAISTD